jgi:uncharacterized protein (UPF0548 family)
MLFLTRPEPERIAQFIMEQRDKPFSYAAVGATRGVLPHGFVVDHNRIQLGKGEKVFETAKRALTGWKMFDLGWVEVFKPDTAIEPGETVAVLAKISRLWFLNACRVVYLVDENKPVRRFGFAYGTLPEHAESGEERFSIEMADDDDSVWYDLLAFSRPNQRLAKLGYPIARMLQKRFARDSKQAMARALAVPGEPGFEHGK